MPFGSDRTTPRESTESAIPDRFDSYAIAADDHDVLPAQQRRMLIVTCAAGALTSAMILAAFGLRIGQLEARMATRSTRIAPTALLEYRFFVRPSVDLSEHSLHHDNSLVPKRQTDLEAARRTLARVTVELDDLRARYASRIADLENKQRSLLEKITESEESTGRSENGLHERTIRARDAYLAKNAGQLRDTITELRFEMERAVSAKEGERQDALRRLTRLESAGSEPLEQRAIASRWPDSQPGTEGERVGRSPTGDIVSDHLTALISSLEEAHLQVGSSLVSAETPRGN